MSRKVGARVAIREYLESVFPEPATENEILQHVHVRSCAAGGALRTLRSRGVVEVVGKKGRANLYRFKPS